MAKNLSPGDRSYEIRLFAQDFLNQVIRGDVTSPEGHGNGYALTSKLRSDYHIGTITAPGTLLASAEMVMDDLSGGEFEDNVPMVRQHLEVALKTLTSAYNLANSKNTKLSRTDASHVVESLDNAIPDLERIVVGLQYSGPK